MDAIFYHRINCMSNPIILNDIQIQDHPDVYLKETKITKIIFNCLLLHRIYLPNIYKSYFISGEMGDIIFNIILLLVKRVNKQIFFTDHTNKKAPGLVNNIIIGDFYTLIEKMLKGSPHDYNEIIFNDENKKIRLPKISFLLDSTWKISMVCRNILLVDIPFRMIGNLMEIENKMSTFKVDINKETRVKIIRDILTMIFHTN